MQVASKHSKVAQVYIPKRTEAGVLETHPLPTRSKGAGKQATMQHLPVQFRPVDLSFETLPKLVQKGVRALWWGQRHHQLCSPTAAVETVVATRCGPPARDLASAVLVVRNKRRWTSLTGYKACNATYHDPGHPYAHSGLSTY